MYRSGGGRFRVHPIRAQQGQNITTVLLQKGGVALHGGKQNTLGAPGLPDCCDWRPVGGALVQPPQQRRSVLSPLKQGNFCRVCGVGVDRMRSLVCRKRATGHFPTHGDAGRLSVWLNQHQTKWPAQGCQAGSRVRVSSCTSGNFHFPRQTGVCPSVRLSVCPSLLFLPEAVEQVEHQLLAGKPSIPPRTCTTDTTYSTVAHDCRPVGERGLEIGDCGNFFFFDRCTAPCSAVAPYAPCIVPEMGS